MSLVWDIFIQIFLYQVILFHFYLFIIFGAGINPGACLWPSSTKYYQNSTAWDNVLSVNITGGL